MFTRKAALCSVSMVILSALASPAAAQAGGGGGGGGGGPGGPPGARASGAAAAGGTTLTEVVVTANKREENINNVGISIAAATGDQLTKLGVTSTQDLQKIVPGFISTPTYYGTTVFTIRGVGFQDTSLAGSPTVSVYLDEVPLPFAALTNGASMDLDRVEVLKGPQGTLFGENATGGAVNYIGAKPTDTFHYGGDFSYGRFNDTKFNGYVSGPLTDTLDARFAIQTHNSDAWQKGYGPQEGQTIGGSDFLNGRLSLLWKPTSRLRVLATFNGWQDKSFTQMGQLYGIAELSPLAPLAPAIANYPKAPQNDQAAGWNQCVNTSPYDPISGQNGGTLYLVNGGHQESEGPGSVVQQGGQPTHCIAPRNNNTFFSASIRADYDLGRGMTLTSISASEKFNRTAGIDGSGMPIQDYQSYQRGKITVAYQELRLAGHWWDNKGNWLVGLNYEYDGSWDSFLQTYNASTASPTLFAYDGSPAALAALSAGNPNSTGPILGPGLFGFALGPTKPTDRQIRNTYSAFVSGDYPITDQLTVLGGVRFTRNLDHAGVCGDDGGDGSWANVAYALQGILGSTAPKLSPPGTCASTGPASQNFNSPPNGGLFSERLTEDNVSWRAGVNYKLDPNKLLYVNISKGYKSGSFPTVALSTFVQALPVHQEGLLSYEAGFKFGMLEHQLQLNGAFFYYDYTNKQILGAIADILFGALPALVNVPKSHVAGFELSANYTPSWLPGLSISPGMSYQDSRVDASSQNVCSQSALTGHGVGTCVPNHYYGFDAFSQYADFTGEPFPSAPRWQASVDGEYDFHINDNLRAFVGGTFTYTSKTTTFFYNLNPIQPVGPEVPDHPNDPTYVKGYALLDLRAGIESGRWRAQLWGRNVTNTYYWTSASHVNDVLLRYTGLPVTYGFTLSYKY